MPELRLAKSRRSPELRGILRNGAKALADGGTKKRVTPEFFARYSVAELQRQSDYRLGRLTSPMILAEGSDHYRPTTWDAAFKLIGKTVNCLESPNHAAFYTSGKTSNKAAFPVSAFRPGNLGRTIYPIVPTCATNQAAAPC